MGRRAISGFRAFVVIWFGQLVSLTGSGLTAFALGVWVYLNTGSTTLFALIQLVSALPALLIGPLAGALVDRWDRRHAMIFSDAGAAACTLAMVLLLAAGRLEMWHIYLLLGLSACFAAFQWPAYSSATTLMVPPAQYARASGMVQMAQAVAETIAPAVAGALLGTLMIHGVMAVDLATFCVALVTLLLVRVPAVAREVAPEGERTSLLSEVAYGWRYIRERRGLFALLALFAVLSFTTGITAVLYTPLMLGLTTPAVLGLVTSIAGLGLLASSLLMSTWGGPRRRIVGVFAAEIVLGVAVMAMGLSVNPVVLGASLFLAYLTIPVVNACSQAIWQVKTAPEVQGRVFSFRRVIAGAMTPLAFVLAGPLADGVFNPLLAEGGAWASGIGQLVGVGAGRGIGALNLILGIITIAATLVAMAYRPLRQVESDLPDALPAPAAGSAEEEAPPPVGGAALATD